MSLTKERVYYLLKAYISKQASSEEELELMEWILEADEDSELKSYVREIWDQYLLQVLHEQVHSVKRKSHMKHYGRMFLHL